jgi:hypothetical protein
MQTTGAEQGANPLIFALFARFGHAATSSQPLSHSYSSSIIAVPQLQSPLLSDTLILVIVLYCTVISHTVTSPSRFFASFSALVPPSSAVLFS